MAKKKKTAKKAATKKKVTKKAKTKSAATKKNVTKKVAKKKVAKKKVAKKAAAKKKTAKKVVKKKVAKKTAVKKKTAKKVAAKKKTKVVKKATTKKKAAPKAPKKVSGAKASAAVKKEKPAKKTKDTKKQESIKTKAKEAEGLEEIDEALDDEDLEDFQVEFEDEVTLTDAEGRRYCRVSECDQLSVVDGYCRFHYLLFWKKIQQRNKILADGKLENYIEELTSRYSDKFIEILCKDLKTEKDFLNAVQELEIDDSLQPEDEDSDDDSSFIEEIRGVAVESSKSVTDDDY